MTYDMDALSLYRNMVIERHQIWTRRQINEPAPWTTDPVLANLKTTNMFRVLDPGSQFVFVLDSTDPLDTITRLVFYRVTNRPKTWYAMRNMLGGRYPVALDFTVKPQILLSRLLAYRDEGNQVFSGAYIIIPEPGTKNDKVSGAFNLTRRFVEENAVAFLSAETQEERFAVLRSTPGLGRFLSMQILTDWGYLQFEEPDLSFVVAGPGAHRGAAILDATESPENVIHDTASGWSCDQTVTLAGRPLTPMDVQNTMCEFSKYAREIKNPRKITAYKPAHSGPQPKPVLPQWW